MPTIRNPLFHLHRRAYEDWTVCSETLVFKLQTPRNNPKESTRILYLNSPCNTSWLVLGWTSSLPFTGKGKAILLQALTGPEGSRRLRLPDFKTIGTWRWSPLPPGNIPGTHFCLRISQPQGHSAAGRINSNETIENRSRDLPVCRTVPQPLRAPPFTGTWRNSTHCADQRLVIHTCLNMNCD
jgi:hypothetical protein